MKDCKFVKISNEISEAQEFKYKILAFLETFWPHCEGERERQGRLLCRRVVVVRGCRLWHIGEDSFFQMLGDGGTN